MKQQTVEYDGRKILVTVDIPVVTKGLGNEWGISVEFRSILNPVDSQHEIYKFEIDFLRRISQDLDEDIITFVLLTVFTENIELFFAEEPWKLKPVAIDELILARILG